MKSICAAAFLVLAAACHKADPVDSTLTTSSDTPPVADTSATKAPPAVPELGTNAAGQKRVTAVAPSVAPTAVSEAPATTTVPDEVQVPPADPATAPIVQGTTTTTTTTTVTTGAKKPVVKQGNGFGTGAARGNGINSSGPVGNGGGGIR